VQHVFSFDNFVIGAEICASNISSVEEYLELVNYKIEDIITFFMLGSDFAVFRNKMDQYWHKELDYRYGFCYSFQPPDRDHGVIKLLNVASALNMVMISLNVSCYLLIHYLKNGPKV
jgi:protein tyrosine phosphatase